MAIDPDFEDVVFLMGADTALADESRFASTVSTYGNITRDTGVTKFGAGSVEFTGTAGDMLIVPYAGTDMNMGSDPWTLEAWIRFSSLPVVNNARNMILGQWNPATSDQSWRFYTYLSGANHQLGLEIEELGNGGGDSTWLLYTWTPVVDTWHHVCFDFDGVKYRAYADGVNIGSDDYLVTAATVDSGISLGGFINGVAVDTTDSMLSAFIDEARVTLGTARYATDTSFTVPAAAFPRSGPGPGDFLDTLTETVEIRYAAGEIAGDVVWAEPVENVDVSLTDVTSRTTTTAPTDTMRMQLAIEENMAFSKLLTETTNVSPTLGVVPAVVLAEAVDIALNQAPSFLYNKTLIDTAELAELLAQALPATLSDTTNLSELLVPLEGVIIAEALEIAPSIVASGLYGKSLADNFSLVTSLANFFGGDITDGLNILATLASVAQFQPVLADGVDVSEAITPALLLNVVASEDIEITPIEAINMLYSDTVVDGIEIVAGYLAPGTGLTTWTMNTRNTAVSTYDNFDFNSFASLGNKYVGASSTGVYELNGDTDAGQDIIATLRGGYMQFGGTKLSRLKSAYIAARGEGDFVLKIETGDGATYSYAVSTRDMRSTKVHMGKGQRARYFAFELISTGQDFDLDTLEFVPVVMQRRV